jgi:NADH:ubiquinone oxidoreductase subunit B-like Fe-S oxidoreductase
MFVPGCPPKPEGILYGIVQLLNKVRNNDKPK